MEQKTEKYKVAVLMSTYNGEQYLSEQIESILNQDCDVDVNLIVRDDGSTDGTLKILEEYEKKKLLTWSRGENLRPAKSFWSLIINNPGYDLYAFADQDDIWYKNKLTFGIEALKNNDGVALYSSNVDLIDENGKPLERTMHKRTVRFNKKAVLYSIQNAHGCTVMINKAFADIIGKCEMPEKIIMHDTYLSSLCIMLGGEYIYDSRSTLMYRLHGDNCSAMATKEHEGYMAVIKARWRLIFHKRSVDVSDQIKDILTKFGEQLTEEGRKDGREILDSKKNLFQRIRISLSPAMVSPSKSLTLANRIRVLIGNY